MPATLTSLIFAVVLACCATAAWAAPEYELHLVQVLHRHGARSPIVSYNETAICGTEFPCGYLNRPGQTMLRNAGAFLRERYTQDASVVDPAAPFLDSDAYNLTVSYSRSTDVLRTLQSSVALLRGLFPDMDNHYPAIHTVDRNTDIMLRSDAAPAVKAKQHYGRPEEEARCLPVVDKRFPDHNDILEMAREVHSEGKCSAREDRLSCAMTLCDIGLAYESTGELKQHKKLNKNLAELCEASACSVTFQLSFNNTDPAQVSQGSLGQSLAQEMIGHMRQAKSRDKPTFKFYEYSAHDTTVAPLSATFGDNSAVGMMPPFATTFIVELLAKRKGKSGGGRKAKRTSEDDEVDYFVRVLRGYPGVTPESEYTFSLQPFEMQCMTTLGKVYVAENNVCPFEDFVRFVDSTKPGKGAGLCYIDPIFYERMKCPKHGPLLVAGGGEPDGESGDGDAGTKPADDCLHFRRLCPSVACPEGFYLSAVDYGCYEKKTVRSGGGDSSAVVAVGAVAFFLGALVGLGLLLVKRLCEQKRRRQGYSLPTPSAV